MRYDNALIYSTCMFHILFCRKESIPTNSETEQQCFNVALHKTQVSFKHQCDPGVHVGLH